MVGPGRLLAGTVAALLLAGAPVVASAKAPAGHDGHPAVAPAREKGQEGSSHQKDHQGSDHQQDQDQQDQDQQLQVSTPRVTQKLRKSSRTSVPLPLPTDPLTIPPTPAPPTPTPPPPTPTPTTTTGPGGQPTPAPQALPSTLPVAAVTRPTPAPAPLTGAGLVALSPVVPADAGAALAGPVRAVFDSPLGPTPPVAGLLLVFFSLLLAVRRRVLAVRRERALEAAKSAFIKDASHQLRTPLTVLRGYLDLAADGSLGGVSSEMGEVLRTLDANVSDLHRLTELLLEAAQIDIQQLSLQVSVFDLREKVRERVLLMEGKDSSVRSLVVETDARPVTVRADRDRMATIVDNLVDNAMRHAASGEVRVRVGSSGRQAFVEVEDRGPGISAADLPHLFSRFRRGSGGRRGTTGGTGLGLYLARELARLHGGDVRVHSVEGEGSTFTVLLPLAESLWSRLFRGPGGQARAAPG